MKETLATYNIQIQSESWSASSDTSKRVLSNLPAMLEAVEEDLTNLLPPGYEARIREWSSDE